MPATIKRSRQFEDAPLTLMDRVEGVGGAVITQATVSAATYDVTQHDTEEDAVNAVNGTSVVDAGSLTVSSIIFDTLQTASPWNSTLESTGYNFRHDSPGTDRPVGGKWNRHEYKLTTASGDIFVVWVVEVLAIQQS